MASPTSDIASLTIVVAPPGPLVGVRDVLADWAAAGLVGDFAWTHPSAAIAGESLAHFVDGQARAVTLRQLLATRRPTIVRLLALHPHWQGSDASDVGEAARALAMGIDQAGGRAHVVRAHVHIARGVTPVPPLATAGWHNLLLSPEDSFGPGEPADHLPVSDDMVDIGLHAAPTVAALGGLCHGLTAAPLDDLTVPPGPQITVVRSYLRVLDTRDIEVTLRRAVSSLRDGYPRTVAGDRPTVEAPDPSAAAQLMADQVWARHRSLLRSARVKPPQGQARAIGAWAALRHLFSFLWAALRNAPAAWWRSTVTSTRAGIAGRVGSFVYGDEDSDYQVVVKGVTASGSPRDWHETLGALRRLDDDVAAHGADRAQEARADFAPLWRDYVDGALTLMDGHRRSDGLAPVTVGDRVGVLATPVQCVPAPRAAFDDVPAALAGAVPSSRVPVADILAAGALASELDDLSSDPQRAVSAATTLERLKSWGAEQRATYATCITRELARAFGELQGEIADNGLLLQKAHGAATLDQRTRAGQESLARTMRFLLLFLALAWVVVGALWAFDVLAPGTAAAIGAGCAALWFVSALVIFLNNQRELFQLLHAREEALSQAEAAQTNLSSAIRDARRVGDAYSLAMHWTSILGAFLDEPLGRSDDAEHQRPALLIDRPMSLQVATAGADARTLARHADAARGHAFRSGWMTQAWEECLNAASDLIIDAGLTPIDATELFHQRNAAQPPHLAVWSQSLAQHGFASPMRTEVWERALSKLSAHREELISRLDTLGSGRSSRTTLDDMLDPRVPLDHQDGFEAQSFSPSALVAGRNRIRDTWSDVQQVGLGGVVVVVQQSAGLEPEDLTGNRSPRAADHGGPRGQSRSPLGDSLDDLPSF